MQFQQRKLLSELSTFGIGGPAKAFIEVKEIEALRSVIAFASHEKMPYLVIGKGSNCLFDDRGFDGLVILNKIAFLHEEKEHLYVGAGYSFSLLGVQTARRGFTGLEFASGIPATVGGAVYMNAGAGGEEVSKVIAEVEYISDDAKKIWIKAEECMFSYRSSLFQKQKGAIAAARFHLKAADGTRKKQLDLIAYRTRTQPYDMKSAGCAFRNPPGYSAGALIEKCGLKGKRIGGAEVSTLHANFLVNREKASTEEILELAAFVKKTVKQEMGIELEMEVRVIPYIPS